MAYSKRHVAAGGRARGRKQEKRLWDAEMFGRGGTSADAKKKKQQLFIPAKSEDGACV